MLRTVEGVDMTRVCYAPGYKPPEDFGEIHDLFILNSGWVKLTNTMAEAVYMPPQAFVWIEGK